MTIEPPANLPAPADAAVVDEWADELGNGTAWGRFLRCTRRATAAGASVTIYGWQEGDGAVARYAHVAADGIELDAIALRQFAALALDAADELESRGNRPA